MIFYCSVHWYYLHLFPISRDGDATEIGFSLVAGNLLISVTANDLRIWGQTKRKVRRISRFFVILWTHDILLFCSFIVLTFISAIAWRRRDRNWFLFVVKDSYNNTPYCNDFTTKWILQKVCELCQIWKWGYNPHFWNYVCVWWHLFTHSPLPATETTFPVFLDLPFLPYKLGRQKKL